MTAPPRWPLPGDTPTEFADIEGLFVDRVFPVEPTYERYTLRDCAPAGPPLAAVEGSGPAWFGNVVVEGARRRDRPPAERYEPVGRA